MSFIQVFFPSLLSIEVDNIDLMFCLYGFASDAEHYWELSTYLASILIIWASISTSSFFSSFYFRKWLTQRFFR